MSNTLRGEVTVTLGGEEFTLAPTFDAICEFEERVGASVISCIQKASEKGDVSMRVVASALWAGIRGSDKNKEPLPYQEVGRRIVADGLPKFIEVSMTFLSAAMMSDEEIATADAYTKKE